MNRGVFPSGTFKRELLAHAPLAFRFPSGCGGGSAGIDENPAALSEWLKRITVASRTGRGGGARGLSSGACLAGRLWRFFIRAGFFCFHSEGHFSADGKSVLTEEQGDPGSREDAGIGRVKKLDMTPNGRGAGRFLAENLQYPRASVDAVLLWVCGLSLKADGAGEAKWWHN